MQVIKGKNFTWVDIKKPTNEDIEWLDRNFELHPLVLKELSPDLDYPKVEDFGDYIYVVLFYPFFQRESYKMVPFELDIIVGKDYIITSHPKGIVTLKALFDRCNLYEDEREKYFEDGTGGLLYQITHDIFKKSFPKLSHIKENIDEIEDSIYSAKYTEMVSHISLVERDIIGFKRILDPQEIVLQKLSITCSRFFPSSVQPYFHELIHVYNQVQNLLKTREKTLKALKSTNQSLLTNRTNEIIKILTVFSVITFPLTVVASLFGMNTGNLPIIGHPQDFWIILGIMSVISIGMLLFFKWRRWT